ncbi:MAG: PepSY domain-containing protein [Sulfuricaulis sp.]
MLFKSKLLTAAVVGVLVTSPAFAGATNYTGHELASKAKITIEQARAIALKAHAGKITDEELEKEKGGSGLRYSFDIRRGKVTQEVGVDAVTGKLLENAPEGPNAD